MKAWQKLLRESSQDKLTSDDDFLLYESPKKKLKLTLKSIGVSPVHIHGVPQHSCTSNAKGKLKKVLNVYKENISTTYVSDIEIEEPPPIYDTDFGSFLGYPCHLQSEGIFSFSYASLLFNYFIM